MTYRLIEKDARVYAVDANGVEICGARQPYGHDNWVWYPTVRLGGNLHQMLATTRDAAVAHVEMVAALYVQAHPLQQVWGTEDARELAKRAAEFDSVNCSGALVDLEEPSVS